MPSDGPSWSVSPIEWGAQVNYDAWTDAYTPDDGVALHHGGGTDYAAGNAPFTEGKEIALLRVWEDYHLSKGWRGLAYGWALGQTGTVYRGRGWSTYGAHTGDLDADGIVNNVEIIPIVFLGSGNHHELSDQASSSLILLRRYLEEVSGRELKLYGHQELKGTVTTCPGPNLMNYVVNNRFLEDDEMTQEQLNTVLAAVAKVAPDVWKQYPGGPEASAWQQLIRIKADTIAIRDAVGALDVDVDALAAELSQIAVDSGVAEAVVSLIATKLAEE